MQQQNKRSMRIAGRTLCGLLFLLALSACDSDAPTERPEPVVVYATEGDEANLAAWFSAFTAATGIPVTVRYEDATTQTDNVIANEGAPPADLLLTNNVADIWRAADEGALRPIQAASLALIPENLQDPDGLWSAIDTRLAIIVKGVVDSGPLPTSYSDLADPLYRGQLCLASSSVSINRSLVAMMIAEAGVRPAELTVRGWVSNLAVPPFDTERQLQAAIDSGTCTFGIVSTAAAGETAATIQPRPAHADIRAIGITRHARYPESAQRLVDWLLSERASEFADGIVERNIGMAGWHDEDARLLAERAGYR